MKWYSTRDNDHYTDTKNAVIQGLAPDEGLYMPEEIPALRPSVLSSLSDLSLPEVSFEVAKQFFGADLSNADLQNVVENALDFPIPIVQMSETNRYTLELFHGPTLAFKDVGARFMARLLSHFMQFEKERVTVLVATSGDTGSAVAQGFLDVEGIDVVLLFPDGKVSSFQKKQLSTIGKNITALRVDGTFDDCQRMVKEAFIDEELQKQRRLTSANSINIARLLPQSFYYFHAIGQLGGNDENVIISVPSGNFGNLTAGLIAKKMGLNVSHFIASTNVNKIVPNYLQTGVFKPQPSKPTLSNAMDVGNPSNFERLMAIFGEKRDSMIEHVSGVSFTDSETIRMMGNYYEKHDYLLDPHGAVAAAGLEKVLGATSSFDGKGLFLECAHPAKFAETVEEATGVKAEVPDHVKDMFDREDVSIAMSNQYKDFKSFLLGG
jgi:threonine synthase